jgi:hypothetical protein
MTLINQAPDRANPPWWSTSSRGARASPPGLPRPRRDRPDRGRVHGARAVREPTVAAGRLGLVAAMLVLELLLSVHLPVSLFAAVAVGGTVGTGVLMVEHEAFVALLARDVGVRTPRLRAAAAVGEDGMLLAYELVDGRSFDRFDGEVTDGLLDAIWEQAAIRRRLNTAAGFAVHLVVLVLFLVWAGRSAFGSIGLPDPDKLLYGLAAVAVLAVISLAVRRFGACCATRPGRSSNGPVAGSPASCGSPGSSLCWSAVRRWCRRATSWQPTSPPRPVAPTCPSPRLAPSAWPPRPSPSSPPPRRPWRPGGGPGRRAHRGRPAQHRGRPLGLPVPAGHVPGADPARLAELPVAPTQRLPLEREP